MPVLYARYQMPHFSGTKKADGLIVQAVGIFGNPVPERFIRLRNRSTTFGTVSVG